MPTSALPSTNSIDLETLGARVRACEACPEMRFSHVLGPANGLSTARVLFVGEAPGRLGAGRSGVPFQGDESGRRFEALLAIARLDRASVFVTNAVLCNPVDAAGNNRRPRTSDVQRCLPFLRDQLLAVDAGVIVALGEVALSALGRIEAHGATLRSACAQPVEWFGRVLVPLYHPGRRALVHRSDALQQDDWRQWASIIEG